MHSLDKNKLHVDILKKLLEIGKPKNFLQRKKIISRATLSRLSKGNDINFDTFFKLINWLEKKPENYFKELKN